MLGKIRHSRTSFAPSGHSHVVIQGCPPALFQQKEQYPDWGGLVHSLSTAKPLILPGAGRGQNGECGIRSQAYHIYYYSDSRSRIVKSRFRLSFQNTSLDALGHEARLHQVQGAVLTRTLIKRDHFVPFCLPNCYAHTYQMSPAASLTSTRSLRSLVLDLSSSSIATFPLWLVSTYQILLRRFAVIAILPPRLFHHLRPYPCAPVPPTRNRVFY